MHAVARPRFYTGIALITAALIVAGFSRSYFFRPFFDRPPLDLLHHAHALAFTAWLVLFFVQARLIAARRAALHMKLGIAGAIVALAMVASTVAVSIHQGRIGRVIAGIDPHQFMAGSMVAIVLFAVFVGSALALRRRPEWHRRLMILATISTIGPAVGRLVVMLSGNPQGVVARGVIVALIVACLLFDWRRYRLVHPAYLAGGALILVSWPLRAALSKTDAWMTFARWLTS
jgi:hypothetical protein